MASGWYNETENKAPVWSGSRGMPLRRSPNRDKKVKQIHTAFSVVGFIAGVGAAIYAYSESSSWALAIFVFLAVNTFISRGLGDVATDPHKVKRFLYFMMQPAWMITVLYLTYQWWGIMWLSALLGALIGLVVSQILGILLFPQIHAEEMADTNERMST